MRIRLLILSTLGVALLTGCGDIGSYPAQPPGPTPVAPSISNQPTSLTVPIGLEGIFRVAVSGSTPLTYQWFRNGTAINSTNSLSYTTPTVAAADTGTVYTVTISNSAGSVTSQPATLTAGARAPKNGDLRFQQVDSENTVNGYGYGTGPGLPGATPPGGGLLAGNAIGVASLSSYECGSLFGCTIFINSFKQPAGSVPLAISFNGGQYSSMQTDLSQGFWSSMTFGGGPVTAPNNVITHLQLDPADNAFDIAYTQTSQTGGFDLAQHTINSASLAAAAQQEGMLSRVITAISYNAGQITYFSYGWTGDRTTIYETRTATATFDNVGTVAASLAAQGYIITAIGGDATNGVVMVGTRVQGDTMPRSILIEPSFSAAEGDIPTGGYALVGVVNNLQNSSTTGIWIGQR
jgi:hypothetical protein